MYVCMYVRMYVCMYIYIHRVPLIPYVTPSVPDVSDEKGKRKSTIEVSHPPREDITGLDLDSQLIVHGYNIAIAGIFNLVSNIMTNRLWTIGLMQQWTNGLLD